MEEIENQRFELNKTGLNNLKEYLNGLPTNKEELKEFKKEELYDIVITLITKLNNLFL